MDPGFVRSKAIRFIEKLCRPRTETVLPNGRPVDAEPCDGFRRSTYDKAPAHVADGGDIDIRLLQIGSANHDVGGSHLKNEKFSKES